MRENNQATENSNDTFTFHFHALLLTVKKYHSAWWGMLVMKADCGEIGSVWEHFVLSAQIFTAAKILFKRTKERK